MVRQICTLMAAATGCRALSRLRSHGATASKAYAYESITRHIDLAGNDGLLEVDRVRLGWAGGACPAASAVADSSIRSKPRA